VRLSRRLTSSPACLVVEEGELSPQISQILRQAGQDVSETKPILEVNPDHPLLEKLREIGDADRQDPRIAQYAELLLGQAKLAEGASLDDPAAFSRKLADLMTKAL
jgi:molecular chaperone HtpG